jgi:transposase
MEGRDFRSIGRPAQEELRRRALVLILEQGLTQAHAAEIVGVQRQTVNVWLQRYRAQGAGRGRRARRAAGVAAPGQGAADGRRGGQGPRLNP